MKRDDPRHGAYAGWLTHRREGEKPCDPCRLAYNDYMRQWRQKPENRARVARENNARTRAVWRLATLHRDEFERLYLIELGPPEMEEPA